MSDYVRDHSPTWPLMIEARRISSFTVATHEQTFHLCPTKNNQRDTDTIQSFQGKAEYPGNYDTIGFNHLLLLIPNSNALLVRLRELLETDLQFFILANCEIIY